jgi:hypothetical protein
MTEHVTLRRHGSYGIDAPYAPAFIAVMTVIVLVMAIISGHWQTFVPITVMLAVLGFYLHSTLRGKFAVWADLLDRLHLRGDERILDMGCGRRAVLLMAAQRLTTLAHDAGFKEVQHVSAAMLAQRYFAGRTDGLRPPNNSEELLVAAT